MAFLSKVLLYWFNIMQVRWVMTIWKDVSSSRNHGTLVNKTIQEIVRKFPKYFSRGHKNCVQTLTENLMLDKISLPSLVLFTQNLPETTL